MVSTDNAEHGTIAGFWRPNPPESRSFVGRAWRKELLKLGDSVTIEYCPLRDGRSGGKVLRVVLADGQILTTGSNRLVK